MRSNNRQRSNKRYNNHSNKEENNNRNNYNNTNNYIQNNNYTKISNNNENNAKTVEKQVIKTKYSMARDQIHKNIDYFKYCLELNSTDLCLRLTDILTYISLPNLSTNENLIIFLRFIRKMILTIQMKNSTDLESTQKQIDLLKNTIFGFLENGYLFVCIAQRLNTQSKTKLKNKNVLMNEEEKNIFMDIIKYIAEYCFSNGKDYFKKYYTILDISTYSHDDIRQYQRLIGLLQEKNNDKNNKEKFNVYSLDMYLSLKNKNLTLPFEKDFDSVLTIMKVIAILIVICNEKIEEKELNQSKYLSTIIVKYLELSEFLDKIKEIVFNKQSNLEQEKEQQFSDFLLLFSNYQDLQSLYQQKYLEYHNYFQNKHKIYIKPSPQLNQQGQKQQQKKTKQYNKLLQQSLQYEYDPDNDNENNSDDEEEEEVKEENKNEIFDINGEVQNLEKLKDYKKEVDIDTNIVPTEEDCLNIRNYRGYLKKIDMRQSYKNQEEYLQNMFSYLRADSHQEIVLQMNNAIKIGRSRINIKDLDDEEHVQDEINKLIGLNHEFHFYNNIDIINVEYSEGLTFTLSVLPILSKKNLKFNVETTKRLLGDQYVYLTDYNFTKIYVCQVENLSVNESLRKLESLHRMIRVKLKIIGNENQSLFKMKEIQEFIFQRRGLLIETKEYNGQYFSCMKAIKQMITMKFNIPFQKNILQLQNKVTLPSFIDEHTEYLLDFSPLNEIKEEKKNNGEDQGQVKKNYYGDEDQLENEEEEKGYKQKLFEDWKDIPTIKNLNESQVAAIKNILTKEISIIQGPPGTGKTYVGAMAMRNILKNWDIWNKDGNPILMCCKTNHALDQFLAYIMKFEQNIVRIGSRSKNEEIRKFQLNNIRQNYIITNSLFYQKLKYENEFNVCLNYLSKQLFDKSAYLAVIEFLPKDIVINQCRRYLCSFYQNLPFLYNEMEQILTDYSLIDYIKIYWWSFNSDPKEMMKNLFIPMIKKYSSLEFESYDFQVMVRELEDSLQQYAYGVSQFQSDYLKQFYLKKQLSVNYFYKNSQDDENTEQNKLDQKQENQDKYVLWSYLLSKNRKKQNQKNNDDDDEDNDNDDLDENEYNEDRENFIVDDEGQEENSDEDFYDYGDDDENSNKNKNKRKYKNKKQNKKKTSLKKKEAKQDAMVYLTYYQLLNFDVELGFEQRKDKFESNFIFEQETQTGFYQDQILLRLYAIQKHSQKNEVKLAKLGEIEKYLEVTEKLKQEKIYSDIQIIKKSKVVAMTLGGISKYSDYLKYLNYKILIIEEAAEVLENLSVPLLQPFLQQLILIGDHQQLKPTVNSYEMEKKYNMNVSLFQRLIKNDIDYVCLNEQMRMSEDFSQYVRFIYNKPNQYQDSLRIKDYPKTVRGLPTNIMFFMHNFEELQLEHTTTKKNEDEALLATAFASYLINNKEYNSEQITILTMYLGQAFLIKKSCIKNSKLAGVRVSTIDNYQGEENEIIILSLVRSNPKNLGFIRISNRINVSISRAKKGFIILGNKSLLQTKYKLWSQIFSKARKLNHIYENQFSIKCPQHGTQITINKLSTLKNHTGGCELPCKQQNLTCSHRCKKNCHGGNCDEHECDEKIKKIFKCGHENEIFCYERNLKNLDCKTKIPVDSDLCHHLQQVECYKYDIKNKQLLPEYVQQFYQNQCTQICKKNLSCGHECQQKCHQIDNQFCNSEICEAQTKKTLICGHYYSGQCGKSMKFKCNQRVEKKQLPCGHYLPNVICSFVQKCIQKCTKILSCGHPCEQKQCYEPHKCSQKSKRDLPCGHQIFTECQADLTNHFCNELTEKTLKCGHGKYKKICHEEDNYQCEVQIQKRLPCGHKVEIQCYQNNNDDDNEEESQIQCDQKCLKILDCGHKCEGYCGQPCINKCEYYVKEKKREKCSHLVTGYCYLMKKNCEAEVKFQGNNIKCYEFQLLNSTCYKMLPCGHRCEMLASQICQCKIILEMKCCKAQNYCFLINSHKCRNGDYEDFI